VSSLGPNYPGSSSGFTSSGNVAASDNVYATGAWSRNFAEGIWENTPTPYLTCQTFGFVIGAGDTVNGILVEVEAKRTGPDGSLKAFLARGGVQVGSVKSATLNNSGDVQFNFGSAADVWGGSWNGGNIGSLQVVIYADPSSGSGVGTVSIDFVRASINYTDTTPNAFAFTDVNGQARSASIVSNSVAIAGISAAAAISVVGGEYEKNGSGTWSSSPGTVNNGDSVRVRQTSSAGFNTATNCTLTVGGVSDTFTVTTEVQDTTPNAFSFTDKSGAEPSTQYSSDTLTISGINSAAATTVSGTSGEWRKNGGAWGSGAGTVSNGDTVQVRGTANAAFAGTRDIVLTIGGVSDTYRITTRAADTTPNAFSFVDVVGAVISTLYTSNAIAVGGIEAASNVTFSTSGGTVHEYQKNGGAWIAVAPTTVVNGDTLAVRMISPAGAGTTGNITVTIGGVVDTFSVSTGADTTPDAFAFTTQNNAVPGVVYQSNQVTINGINTSTAVNVDNGGEVSINGAGYASSGFITNGQTLRVRVAAPIRRGSSIVVNVVVGTSTVTFTVNSATGSPDCDL
jgi:hypothetical protein